MMELNQEANRRFMKGEGISNIELHSLYSFYAQLKGQLDQLRDDFFSVKQEVNERIYILDRLKYYRYGNEK